MLPFQGLGSQVGKKKEQSELNIATYFCFPTVGAVWSDASNSCVPSSFINLLVRHFIIATRKVTDSECACVVRTCKPRCVETRSQWQASPSTVLHFIFTESEAHQIQQSELSKPQRSYLPNTMITATWHPLAFMWMLEDLSQAFMFVQQAFY